jgi:peptide/nickel transport system substrate-binding protein
MPEENPAKWETEYGFPAAAAGDVVKGQFKSRLPSTFTGLVFNTRRPVFADVKVRRALSMLYDFEWINLNLYQGKYARTGSYWQNSELSALGVPASDAEKTLLEPFKDQVLPEVMDGTWKPSQTDGSGRDRNVLRAALGLLTEAGYKLQDGALIGADGKPLTFEFLTGSPNDEKLALAYQRTAEKLGVKFTIRTVDDAQLQQRRQTWDYDMIVATYANSLSPGVEQTNRWGSASRDAEGTFNYAGVASPAIDAVIAAITAARDRPQFVDAVRALDRLLISGAYMIPTQNNPEQWLAHWKQYKYPDTTSLSGYQLPVWWQEQ